MTDHILFDATSGSLRLLDQRLLPGELKYITCGSYRDVVDAIRTMAVRGAPAIGVTAAWGCFLAAKELHGAADWREKLHLALTEIAGARPTAVNLEWAVRRMAKAVANTLEPDAVMTILQAQARAIQEEDIAICRRIGEAGASLIHEGDTVLTHCNAGALATAGHGTALGVIRTAHEQGKKIKVIADETRPLLQGARLTAFELAREGIPVTVVCDNACALLLGRGLAQIVITGADRIAANGDSANKIGTCGLAIIAGHFNVPFYIAAPLSTIDRSMPDGGAIPVEQRSEEEVLTLNGVRIAPENVNALNYAFDITPANLIDGIITETGIIRPPYREGIARAFAESGA